MAKRPPKQEQESPAWYPQYRTYHQKIALELCRAQYGRCPYGNAKDGSPNCNHYVMGLDDHGNTGGPQCEPGRLTQSAADYEWEMRRKDR